MTELYGGVSTLILFGICMILSCFIVYFKNLKNLEKHDKKSQNPQIFYVTEKKRTRKPAKKKISIPLEATVVKAEDLKKYFETKD